MTKLRLWQVILGNAAQASLEALDPDGMVKDWRPKGEPFWPATVKPPCAIVVAGGDGRPWIDPDERDTLCGLVPATYSLVLVAGPPSRASEELLPEMVEAIMMFLPGFVEADESSVELGGAPSIGIVGGPQEVGASGAKGAPVFLGAPIEVTLKIPYPAPNG